MLCYCSLTRVSSMSYLTTDYMCIHHATCNSVRSGGGIGDILEPDALLKPSGWRTAFEMSFYLVVVVFLLNAIFGIIFDTFGHLRDGMC